MTDYLETLKKHFLYSDNEDCEDTFLMQVRANLVWNKDLFLILVTKMQICCQNYESKEFVEKWVAEGFWYIPIFIRNWTLSSDFPKTFPAVYYEKAYSLLDDMAFYFFIGNHPRIDKQDLVEVFLQETK